MENDDFIFSPDIDLIPLFVNDLDLHDLDFKSKNTSSNIIKDKYKLLSVECNTPEIGTKIEDTDEYDIKKKKEYYYNSKIKKLFFYPYFNMDKGIYSIDIKYSFGYYENDLYNLYIFKYSKEEKIKIQINNKTIVQILFNKNNNEIELYIFLKSPPKVYIKDKKIYHLNIFFLKN